MDDIRVLLADDHGVVRKGLVALLHEAGGMQVVAEAKDGAEAVSLYRQHRPDVLLLDLRMPELDGVEVVAAVRQEFLTARIIVLTTFDTDEDIYRALRAGAKGFLLKDATFSEIVESIRAVHAGKTCIPASIAAKLANRSATPDLTPRELDVLRLIVDGKSNREASMVLYVSEETVKSHIKSILSKLGVGDRTSAATMALKRGLVR